jgi:hypothetical protein
MNQNLKIALRPGALLLACLLLLAACSGRKKLTEVAPESPRDLQTALTEGPYPWTWFSANGTMKMDSPFFTGSGQYNLRMKQDSLVWMAIRYLGLEVARLQADRDSVVLLNRWDRTVEVYTWQGLAEFTGFPTSLSSLQRLVLGWLPISPEHIAIEQEAPGYKKVKAVKDQLHMSVRVEGDDFQMSECLIRDTRNGAEIQGRQEAWSTLHGTPFSFVRNWEMTPEPNNRVFLQVQIQDGTFSGPLSFPFEIPARYSRSH